MNPRLSRLLLSAAGLVLVTCLVCLAAPPGRADAVYVKRDSARATWEASMRAAASQIEFGPWYTIGPFDNTGGRGFDTVYPPELGFDPKASYPGKGGRVIRWQPGFQFQDGKPNPLMIFDDNDNIAIYLHREITSPGARELPVLMGSDDTLTVWLNGEKLLAHNVTRACILGDEKLTLKLRDGKNELLLKVCQGGGPSGFAFGVDASPDTLLQRIAQDFPGQMDDLLLELDWLRQVKAPKASNGGLMAPEDDAPGGCDGVKDGGTGFHTNLDDHPWWQVDLGKTYPLSHALLYNREACAERNNTLIMMLSDDGESWRKVWQNNGTLFYGARDGKPMRVPLAGQSARYVRLTLAERQYLHLDEVEVYGARDPERNLALHQPATQSSTSPWSTYTPLPGAKDISLDSRSYRPATLEALDLAQKTLAFVQRERPLPAEAAQLAGLKATLASARGDADWKSLYLQTRRLRRQMILQHPDLRFSDLLVVKRPPPLYSHMVDQYEGRHSLPGDGLVRLENWRDHPRVVRLQEGKLPVGSVQHAGLSWDGRRVVFSFCDHTVQPPEARHTFLYEMDLGSGAVRQLTGVPGVDPLEGWAGRTTVLIEDFDPCYLPDGGIVFVSTRNQGFGRCHGGRYTPSYVLYRCDADGRNIRRLSYGEANEWNPSILPNGLILYTRWDYIDRHDTLFQSLWTTHPDGSAVAHYYANYTRNPCMVSQARAIPGSDLVVALASAHHSYTTGSIINVDRGKGEDGLEPVTRVTPEIPFPETEGWPLGSFAHPWPLTADLYLAAFSPDPMMVQGNVTRPNAYGIYLVDSLGGRELIYRDPAMSCFCPLPLQPRPTPPVVNSLLDARREDGTFIVQNVYRCVQKLPPGSIKSLRVVGLLEQPTAACAARSVVDTQVAKSVIGTVPVNPDGSVAFRAPAKMPLLFQLLDERDMSVFAMRSQVYLQPGETMSCAGCHEPRGSVEPPARPAAPATVASIIPPPGPAYPGGFSFARTVQPVLDRYCIRCHGLDRRADLNLLGERTAQWNQAYESLLGRAGMVALAQRNEQSDVSHVYEYGAHGGKLAALLLGEHARRAPLDRGSFTRLAEWLDLNGQYYGDYAFDRPERREPSAAGVAALRARVQASCGECHASMAKQPLSALLNVALPEESRALQAPLATSAGGWGQCRQAWGSRQDQGYQAMLQAVRGAAGPG